MFEPALRLKGMRESVIREMTRLALQSNAINLAQGFPDYAPPPEIIEAAHRALDAGHNQYAITWGVPELRQAISAAMHKWYGLHYDPDQNITVTCGVTEAIVAALLAVANPGDEVVIVEPFHENYLPAALYAQAAPVFVPLEPPRYALDPDRLRRSFSNKTRAIILNSPHNPTGRVFSRAELEAVAQLCREFNVIAITDEIYEHIVYDGRQHIPLASLDGMYDRTITISGLGKTFAVTGWRLGYACAPEPFATALRTVHDFTTICAPAPLQYAAVAALQLPDSYYQNLREDYAKRRTRMMSILEENAFTAQPPEGAYYVMAGYEMWLPIIRSHARSRQPPDSGGRALASSEPDFEGDDFAFARFLTKEVGVAVVPGSSFYFTKGLGKNHVRFAFAKKNETFDAVEQRLSKWKR